MERARAQVDSPGGELVMAAADVRAAGFDLQRGGYDIAHIDAALARLESALANRERQENVAALGSSAWTEQARSQARIVLARMRRPVGQRFIRAGALRVGYSVRDVDVVADRIADYLTKGVPLSDAEVRAAVFRRRRNGYAEWQVDAVLDRVVAIILAIS